MYAKTALSVRTGWTTVTDVRKRTPVTRGVAKLKELNAHAAMHAHSSIVLL